MSTRVDGRRPDELRPVHIERGFLRWADGSAVIASGRTKVVCSANVSDGVPPFRRGTGKGWITASYGMLPGSAEQRISRERMLAAGRTHEIRRLIGRSLRAVTTLWPLGERTVHIDCDVLDADGGTRTAAVTGAYIALYDALLKHLRERRIGPWPLRDFLVGVSVGVVDGEALLDLTYAEDRRAEVDLNVLLTGSGDFVELQGTGEGAPFGQDALDDLLGLARSGAQTLVQIQQATLGVERADVEPLQE